MEIQLQELIDQIKKDGVEAAEAEAAAILSKAKAEAEAILSDAEAKAAELLANAKNENERMVKSGEDALRQAGRNLLISFRESVAREMSGMIREQVDAVYSSQRLADLIVHVVEDWSKNPDAEDLDVILNGESLQAFEETLIAGLKEKMLDGVTLKAGDNFDGGFRIALNNGSVYYDYSAEAVVEMLSAYLSPKVAQLLKEA